MTVTSAMKGLANTTQHLLDEVVNGNFANYGGKIETLGLVSGDDPEANYVQLPMESTQWSDGFTQDDYKAPGEGHVRRRDHRLQRRVRGARCQMLPPSPSTATRTYK